MGTCVDAGGEIAGVGSLLLPCGLREGETGVVWGGEGCGREGRLKLRASGLAVELYSLSQVADLVIVT